MTFQDLPDKGLFWNRRTHHLALAALKRTARRMGYLAAKEAVETANKNPKTRLPEEGVVWLGYSFEVWLPNNRRRDDDSIVHAAKGHLDGIFNDYLRTDDSTVRDRGVSRTVDKGIRPHFRVILHYKEL